MPTLSLGAHLAAPIIDALLGDSRDTYPQDIPRTLSRDKAHTVISAVLWAYGTRSGSTSGAYAMMTLYDTLGLRHWTFDAEEAAFLTRAAIARRRQINAAHPAANRDPDPVPPTPSTDRARAFLQTLNFPPLPDDTARTDTESLITRTILTHRLRACLPGQAIDEDRITQILALGDSSAHNLGLSTASPAILAALEAAGWTLIPPAPAEPATSAAAPGTPSDPT